MSPRKRANKNKGLEPNLYAETKGASTYYRYRRPDTGKVHGMGTDRQKAIAAARQLNARLMTGSDLVAVVLEQTGHTLSKAIEGYEEKYITNHPALAGGTKYNNKLMTARLNKELGRMLIAHIDGVIAASYLDQFSGDAYRHHRRTFLKVCDYAITKGWRKTNPITPTVSRDIAYEKQRARLSETNYKAIREIAPPWFKVVMDLSLLLCLGRNELAAMQFSDIVDNKTLFVVRKKTIKCPSSRIAITLSDEVSEVIKRAKALPPLSNYVIHKNLKGGRKGAIKNDYLSRTFQSLRDEIPAIAAMPKEQRPTLHEVRALGGHLLEKSGIPVEQIQFLMGHSDKGMTEVYLAGHQETWVPANAGSVTLW